ncbi:MAG TPA: hypothetical protein V6D17_18395 [Candidatus Obscuribacterales bacterium]
MDEILYSHPYAVPSIQSPMPSPSQQSAVVKHMSAGAEYPHPASQQKAPLLDMRPDRQVELTQPPLPGASEELAKRAMYFSKRMGDLAAQEIGRQLRQMYAIRSTALEIPMPSQINAIYFARAAKELQCVLMHLTGSQLLEKSPPPWFTDFFCLAYRMADGMITEPSAETIIRTYGHTPPWEVAEKVARSLCLHMNLDDNNPYICLLLQNIFIVTQIRRADLLAYALTSAVEELHDRLHTDL